MAFGLYVDPIVLSQRHTLYDSDEEAENEKENEISITVTDAKQPVTEGGILLVAVGLTASIFAQSYPVLVDGPTCSILADSQTVFKDKYFPSRAKAESKLDPDDLVCLSEMYAVKSDSSVDRGNCFVCVHKQPLKPEHCNSWASKVHVLVYYSYVDSISEISIIIIVLICHRCLIVCGLQLSSF